MAIIKGFQQLEQVIPYVAIHETWVKGFEIGILDVLEDQRRRTRLRVADDVIQCNHLRRSDRNDGEPRGEHTVQWSAREAAWRCSSRMRERTRSSRRAKAHVRPATEVL